MQQKKNPPLKRGVRFFCKNKLHVVQDAVPRPNVDGSPPFRGGRLKIWSNPTLKEGDPRVVPPLSLSLSLSLTAPEQSGRERGGVNEEEEGSPMDAGGRDAQPAMALSRW